MDKDDLIDVYEAANAIEANLVKNLLVESGIEATVSEQNEPFAGLTIVPPNVYVRRVDEEKARKVVEAYEDELDEKADGPDWKCAKCGEDVPGSFDECFKCGADRPVA